MSSLLFLRMTCIIVYVCEPDVSNEAISSSDEIYVIPTKCTAVYKDTLDDARCQQGLSG